MGTQEIWIERMTSPQVKEAVKQGYSTVLVAVGSNEQHGPHLPTGTDSLIGDKLMDEAARRVGNVLVAPTIRVGASEHHMAYPGTITLREEVLEEIIVDYCRSLARHGFKTIMVVPTHGGNIETVARAAERLKRESLSANAVSLSDETSYLSAIVEVSSKLDITPGEAGTHAGHLETSIVLAVHPDIVDMDKATRGLVEMGYDTRDKLHEVGMHELSPTGILGDATKSTAEAGEDYVEFMASALAEQVKKIRAELGMTS
jgi:creatinine amidohydrolase